MPGGVPMSWMAKWPGAYPVFVSEAKGARFTDVDGNTYIDFCLGDTGSMTGHSPDATVAAIREQAGKHAIELVAADPHSAEIRSGDVTIDEATYTARLKGNVLDLTFKEFELLKYLAQHPGRVFTRAQLLQEIWGYDYFGGTSAREERSS